MQTWIDASPERVWELVSDVELMPTMSQELQSVEWLDGATKPAIGARFVGHSKHDALGEWATTSHVVECEPERVFAWAVEDPANPTAIWRFRLEPKNGGTGVIAVDADGSGALRAVVRDRSACRKRSRRSCSCGCASSNRTWDSRCNRSRSWPKADADCARGRQRTISESSREDGAV